MFGLNELPFIYRALPHPHALTLFTKFLGQRALILKINDAFLYNAGPVGERKSNVVMKKADLGGCQILVWPLIFVWLWVSHPNSLCLSFFIGKLALLIMSTLWD